MHGTGTPLGDPIEIGAAAAVLGPTLGQPTSTHSNGETTHLEPTAGGAEWARVGGSNLVLAAVKSAVGHAEPAAGVSGLAHALLQSQQAAAQPILHLRGVNPHVGAIMSQGPRSGWLAPPPAGGSTFSTAPCGAHCGCQRLCLPGEQCHKDAYLKGFSKDCFDLQPALRWLSDVPSRLQLRHHNL